MRKDSKIEKAKIEATYRYPNLALEYTLSSNEAKAAYCKNARVTQELFEAALERGHKANFFAEEAYYLMKFTGKRIEYLFRVKLTVFDMSKRKHRKKVMVRLSEFIDLRKEYEEPQCKDYDEAEAYFKDCIEKRKMISKARYDMLLDHIKFIKRFNGDDFEVRPIRGL